MFMLIVTSIICQIEHEKLRVNGAAATAAAVELILV